MQIKTLLLLAFAATGLAGCGGGNSGQIPEQQTEPPLPEELWGIWGEPSEDVIAAAEEGRQVSALIHEGGLEYEGPNGVLRLFLEVYTETDGDYPVLDTYFGELQLDGDQLSGRLNYISGQVAAPGPAILSFVLLSGVAVDGDTLSFVLEAEDPNEALEFGVRDFYISKSGDAPPETDESFLKFAGYWSISQSAASFTGSTYAFDLTFPDEYGNGSGVLDGDCPFNIDLSHLGGHTGTEYTRIRLYQGCDDALPYVGFTEWYGYAFVIAPFNPDSLVLHLLIGNDTETLSLVAIKPAI